MRVNAFEAGAKPGWGGQPGLQLWRSGLICPGYALPESPDHCRLGLECRGRDPGGPEDLCRPGHLRHFGRYRGDGSERPPDRCPDLSPGEPGGLADPVGSFRHGSPGRQDRDAGKPRNHPGRGLGSQPLPPHPAGGGSGHGSHQRRRPASRGLAGGAAPPAVAPGSNRYPQPARSRRAGRKVHCRTNPTASGPPGKSMPWGPGGSS